MKKYLGLGKTLYNSSVCCIDENNEVELILNERVTRKKANGSWPEHPLQYLNRDLSIDETRMAESRDVIKAKLKEDILDQGMPFYEYLRSKELHRYTKKFNGKIDEVPHHLAHALTALAMSPFKKSLIVVIDGAGSCFSDFKSLWSNRFKPGSLKSHESVTVFTQELGQIEEVEKIWQTFENAENCKGKSYSSGIGTFYELIAEYIFGSNQASGKVMGLAAFGKPYPISDTKLFLEQLDWSLSYSGKSKDEWESSPNMSHYENLAATAQYAFEKSLNQLFRYIKDNYGEYRNLIIAGGCALNCSYNAKLIDDKLYEQVYIPPFPGDCGISFGLAHGLAYSDGKKWRQCSGTHHGYYGPVESLPEKRNIEEVFSDFNVKKLDNTIEFTCDLLEKGKVIAWYQGRSESGPRALGNRSILASVLRPNLKKYLNDNIKFRESFRPYGCSSIDKYAGRYFDLPLNFKNPYMSFAIKVKSESLNLLKEVSHIDGTSRMQIVTEDQNKLFYNLIESFGKRTGVYCLANTSLNIMGDPIVESVADAHDFLQKSSVDGLIIGDYFVTKN